MTTAYWAQWDTAELEAMLGLDSDKYLCQENDDIDLSHENNNRNECCMHGCAWCMC